MSEMSINSLLTKSVLISQLFCSVDPPLAFAQGLGSPISEDDVSSWDISIPPSGNGLPTGSGDARQGRETWAERCAACHGERGVGGLADEVVGGIGSLASSAPKKTVGSYWPYTTTLFDYVRRAMPYDAPGELTVPETYAVTAYILYLNELVEETEILDASNLSEIQMPNRNGFNSHWP